VAADNATLQREDEARLLLTACLVVKLTEPARQLFWSHPATDASGALVLRD
jgi:hypothetical protein